LVVLYRFELHSKISGGRAIQYMIVEITVAWCRSLRDCRRTQVSTEIDWAAKLRFRDDYM